MNDQNLTVGLGSLVLKNPVMTASGTFGYGEEYSDLINLHRLGAIVVKGLSLKPRPGNPPPRIAETACGMLNAIGLENVGVENFITDKLPFLKNCLSKVVVNVLGDSIEDYQELATRLNDADGIDAIEINISCPNVKHGGVAFGVNPEMAEKVTRAVTKISKLPVIVKLSPNVTDITLIARAVENGGADIISLINTLLGMAIDSRTRKPRLGNIVGGLSGPAIKPVALRMVWQTANTVKIPVIGIGGISTTEDAIEFLLAGASAIQIGTANFFNPSTGEEIIDGIADYMKSQKIESIKDLIGGVIIDS
jgi:dihydroorotate dehydrogenase (NAD+) catalytic subunit